MTGPGKPVPLKSAIFYATHSTLVTNVILVNAIFIHHSNAAFSRDMYSTGGSDNDSSWMPPPVNQASAGRAQLTNSAL